MKKVLIFFLLLMLCSCTQNNDSSEPTATQSGTLPINELTMMIPEVTFGELISADYDESAGMIKIVYTGCDMKSVQGYALELRSYGFTSDLEQSTLLDEDIYVFNAFKEKSSVRLVYDGGKMTVTVTK